MYPSIWKIFLLKNPYFKQYHYLLKQTNLTLYGLIQLLLWVHFHFVYSDQSSCYYFVKSFHLIANMISFKNILCMHCFLFRTTSTIAFIYFLIFFYSAQYINSLIWPLWSQMIFRWPILAFFHIYQSFSLIASWGVIWYQTWNVLFRTIPLSTLTAYFDLVWPCMTSHDLTWPLDDLHLSFDLSD